MRRSSLSNKSSRLTPTSDIKPNVSTVMHPRKAQGKDLLRSTVKSSFEQTVMELKNRPSNKSNEQEYINGLQEEIKFLEYQLKLLKDKEIAERGSLNQLDNFLKDEVPLNQNILAIKNKYNATKSSLQQQHLKLSTTNLQSTQILQLQRQQTKRLNLQISQHQQQLKQRLKQFRVKSSEFARDYKGLKIKYDAMLEENKRRNEEVKRMNDEIMGIYRQNEKEKVVEVRKEDEKGKFASRLREEAVEVKEREIQAGLREEELQGLGDVNPLLQPIEAENVLMKKRLMLNEKQKNTADNRIAEVNLYLEQASKDRQTQRIHKLKLTDQNDALRLQIDELEKHVEQLMDKQLKKHRAYSTKKITSEIQERDRLLAFFGDRLKKLQQDSQALIQDKKQLSDNMSHQQQILKQRKSRILDLKSRILQLQSGTQSTRRTLQIVQKDILPVRNELQRALGRIPLVEKQIEKKREQVEHMNRQVELIKEMKNLNLEEMRLVATGGHQIQESLIGFIKKWEKIKSMPAPAGSAH